MANDVFSDAEFTELMMLRLAAMAVDLRGQLTPAEFSKAPSLVFVLDACDLLFKELGWGRATAPSASCESTSCIVNQRQ